MQKRYLQSNQGDKGRGVWLCPCTADWHRADRGIFDIQQRLIAVDESYRRVVDTLRGHDPLIPEYID